MKGHTNNPNGRPKGSSNKITAEVRECVSQLLHEETPKLKTALDEVRQESPSKYIELVAKLLPYVAPKLSSIQMNEGITDKKLNLPPWMLSSQDEED